MQNDLIKSLEILKTGGVILYPTYTIRGIGCDATNEKAVERIYQIKQWSNPKSMLVLLDNPTNPLYSYKNEVNYERSAHAGNCMNRQWVAWSKAGNRDLAIPKFVGIAKSLKICEFSGLNTSFNFATSCNICIN